MKPFSLSRKLISYTMSAMLAIAFIPSAAFAAPASAAEGDNADQVAEMLAAGEYVEGEALVCMRTDVAATGNLKTQSATSLLDKAEELSSVTMSQFAETQASLEETQGTLSTQSLQSAAEEPVSIRLVSNDSMTTEELLTELLADSRVLSAEPNYVGTIESEETQADSPAITKSAPTKDASASASEATDLTGWQWGNFENAEDANVSPAAQYLMKDGEVGKDNPGINPPNWNEVGKTNSDGVMVVMDSGMDYTNPDLANVVVNFTEEQQKALGCGPHGIAPGREDVTEVMDGFGHGTHCAGIMGAEWNGTGVSGVASGAKLCCVAISNSIEDSSYTSDAIIKGYDFMIRAVDSGVDIRSVNRSFSTYPLLMVDEVMIRAAGEKGIVTCIASGNESANIDKTADNTALYQDNPYVLRVDASSVTDSYAWFTNYGAITTDVFAPGNVILSTYPVAHSTYFAQADTDPLYNETTFAGQKSSDSKIYIVDPETGDELETEQVDNLIGVDGDSTSLKIKTNSNEYDGFYFYIDIPRNVLGNYSLSDVSDLSLAYNVPNSNVQETTLSILLENGEFTSGGYGDSYEDGEVSDNSFNPCTGWVIANTHITQNQHNIGLKDHDFGTVSHDGVECIRLRVGTGFRTTTPIPAGEGETCGDTEKITIYMDKITFGRWNDSGDNPAVLPYAYLGGTSMATPSVAASAAIVPTVLSEVGALTGGERAAAVVSALKGAVHQAADYRGLCKQNGQIDLSKLGADEDSLVPVLETATIKSNAFTVTGTNFGETQGTLTAGGMEAEVKSWSSTKIVAAWPDELASGLIPFEVTSSSGLVGTRAFMLTAPASRTQVPLYERDIVSPQILSDGTYVYGVPTDMAAGPDGTVYAAMTGNPTGIGGYVGIAYSTDKCATWKLMELPENMDKVTVAAGPTGIYVMGAVPLASVGVYDNWQLYHASAAGGEFELVKSYAGDFTGSSSGYPALAYMGDTLLAVGAVDQNEEDDEYYTQMVLLKIDLNTYDTTKVGVLPVERDMADFDLPKVAVDGNVLYVATLAYLNEESTKTRVLERAVINPDGTVKSTTDMSAALQVLKKDFDPSNYAMAATEDAVFFMGAGIGELAGSLASKTNAAPDTVMLLVGANKCIAYDKSLSMSRVYAPCAVTYDGWLYAFGTSGYEETTGFGRATNVELAAGELTVKPVKATQTATYGKKATFAASKVFKVTKNLSKGTVTYKKTSGNKKITVASNGKVTVKKGIAAGTYTVKVQATSAASLDYKMASTTVSFKVKVNKAANKLTVKRVKATQTAAYGKTTTLAAKKVFKVKKNVSKGKVTYKKVKGNKKVAVSKAGKVTVKKGLKRGTYTVKVKATSKATKNYKAKSKTVTFKVKVK